MAGVKATINVGMQLAQTGSRNRGTQSFEDSIAFTMKFAEGTNTVDKTDVLFTDSRTIAASSNDDLDLRGVLTDALGATVNAAEIVAIYVEALTANTNNVVVGAAASNQFVGPFGAGTHSVAVGPGNCFLVTNKNGWAVTAGTGDILRIANSGAGSAVKYNIIILGRTVAA
jgi:hypothetical protein